MTISLTEQGRRLFDRIESMFNSYFGQVLELVPSEKKDVVVESIGLFSEAIWKHNETSRCCG